MSIILNKFKQNYQHSGNKLGDKKIIKQDYRTEATLYASESGRM
jgi:hypothetical protein